MLPAHAVLSYQLGICPPELKHLPRKGHKGKPDPVPINTFIHQSDGADISVAAVVLTLLSYSVCFVLLHDTAVQHMSCLHRLSSPHSPSCNNKTSLGCLERWSLQYQQSQLFIQMGASRIMFSSGGEKRGWEKFDVCDTYQHRQHLYSE